MKITKDMTIAEVLEKCPDTGKVFVQHGLHCAFCPLASQESIGLAAKAHGLNLKKLLADLNKIAKEEK